MGLHWPKSMEAREGFVIGVTGLFIFIGGEDRLAFSSEFRHDIGKMRLLICDQAVRHR